MLPPKIRAVFVKELRDGLRDRRVLFAQVVIPLLLWPIMVLGLAELTQVANSKMRKEVYDVAIPAGTTAFFNEIKEIKEDEKNPLKDENDATEALKKFQQSQSPKAPGVAAVQPPPPPPVNFVEMPLEEAQGALASGKIKAVVVMPADFHKIVSSEGSAEVEVRYDLGEQRSRDAAGRVETMFERYRQQLLGDRLKSKALGFEFLKPFKIKKENVAQATKVAGSLLGTFLPLLFIMIIITGAIHPAIDMTAGEKERFTLETLVASPIRPIEIIFGKFLAVATMSMANATLNVASFTFTSAGLASSLQGQIGQLQFPWHAVPLTLMLLIPLALFFSGLLLAVASIAANQKEAQIYCLPIYIVPVLGMMVLMMPGIELQGPLLVAPVVNTALLIKELFLGHYDSQQIVFVFLSTCFYAAGTIAVAARIFAREEVLFSAQGSLRLFLSRRFFKPMEFPRVGDALLVIALLFPAFFYTQLYMTSEVVTPDGGIRTGPFVFMLAATQYGMFLVLPILVGLYLKLDLKKTFLWKMPKAAALFGAVLLGASSWIVVQQLVAWQTHFWAPSAGTGDLIQKAFQPLSNSIWGVLLMIFVVGVTPAICEEHLFRGFLQQGLRRSGKWTTIALVGIVFGGYHCSLFTLPILSIMGMVLAYCAWHSRSIWPGVIYHMLHNSLSVLGGAILTQFNFPVTEPLPGEPYPDLPLQLLIPAVAMFATGIILIAKSSREQKERDAGSPASGGGLTPTSAPTISTPVNAAVL